MPRRVARSEDDGWLVGAFLDYTRGLTGVGVFDARHVGDGAGGARVARLSDAACVPRPVHTGMSTDTGPTAAPRCSRRRPGARCTRRPCPGSCSIWTSARSRTGSAPASGTGRRSASTRACHEARGRQDVARSLRILRRSSPPIGVSIGARGSSMPCASVMLPRRLSWGVVPMGYASSGLPAEAACAARAVPSLQRHRDTEDAVLVLTRGADSVNIAR